jgi:hypothetical protein
MANEIPDRLYGDWITSIAHIAKPGHPVFRLEWDKSKDNSAPRSVILKAEPASPETLSSVFGLMRETARGARYRVLNKVEVDWLYEAAGTKCADDATKTYVLQFKGAQGWSWIIMGNKGVLVELKDVIGNNDASTAAAILAAMGENEGDEDKESNLERLGMILAVDIFTNNTDRFRLDPKTSGIQNKGNVMFVRKGEGKLRIKGLDPFDPTRSIADLGIVVTGVKDHTDPGYWQGIMLIDDEQLKRIAKNAVNSLNEELSGLMKGKYSQKVIDKLLLDKTHINKVVDGMKKARKQIRTVCELQVKSLANNTQAQAGLVSRMKALKWV